MNRQAYAKKYYLEHKEEYRKRAKSWRESNKEHLKQIRKKWRIANPDKTRQHPINFIKRNPDHFLRVRYGITQQDYDNILIKQKGTCAICSNITRLAVDHDHKTGKIRGILCFKHNTSLGHFNDSIEELEKAIKYLKDAQ